MNIETLKQFCVIAEVGSLSKASELLYVSVQSLSKSMQRLEFEVNQPLFVRQGKHLILSDKGQAYLEYAKAACDILDRGQAAIDSTDATPLRVLAYSENYLYALTDFLDDPEHYKVMTWNGRLSKNILKSLHLHHADLVIGYDSSHVEDRDLEKVFYDTETVYVNIPLSHRFYDRDYLTPEDLKTERILYSESNEIWAKQFAAENGLSDVIHSFPLVFFYQTLSSSNELYFFNLPSKTKALSNSVYVNSTREPDRNIPVLAKHPKELYFWYKPELRYRISPLLKEIQEKSI